MEKSNGLYALTKLTTTAPPSNAGELLVSEAPVNQYKNNAKAWQYLVGQRRVRRLPSGAYDTPSFITSGFSFYDETYIFCGALDRYDWKVIGKKELFVPYNSEKLFTNKIAEVLGSDYVNPDYVRWELHRVWVVEATLASGKRHLIAKRRICLDEDKGAALLADRWDAKQQLWHVGYGIPINVPELPGVIPLSYITYDLLKERYAAPNLFNEQKHHYEIALLRSEVEFSPEALTAKGIR